MTLVDCRLECNISTPTRITAYHGSIFADYVLQFLWCFPLGCLLRSLMSALSLRSEFVEEADQQLWIISLAAKLIVIVLHSLVW